MANIYDVLEDAKRLASGNTPSLKLALWIAALSPNQKLSVNGKLGRAMSYYVTCPLPPNKSDLYDELKPLKAILFRSHVDALYAIEQWYNAHVMLGTIHEYEHVGETYEEQCIWRTKIVSAIRGLGLKTVSFALLIFAPLQCELIPLDRHHLNRLGYTNRKGKAKLSIGNEQEYIKVEKLILQEQSQETIDDIRNVPLALYAWLLWERYRQEKGASKIVEGIESHYAVGLSCREYPLFKRATTQVLSA